MAEDNVTSTAPAMARPMTTSRLSSAASTQRFATRRV